MRTLESIREGQTRELYRRDNHLVVVSTVAELRHEGDDWEAVHGNAVLDLCAAIAPAFGAEYADSGEETMAFLADADGAVIDWGEIAVATGPGSRERVLQELSNG